MGTFSARGERGPCWKEIPEDMALKRKMCGKNIKISSKRNISGATENKNPSRRG